MKIKYRITKDPRVEDFNTLILLKYPQLLSEKNPDLILVAGGDGAMLHTISEYINTNAIFFGKARGTFNFLMNEFENSEEIVSSLIHDTLSLHIIQSSLIKVSVDNKFIGKAANDILIGDSVNGYYHFTISSEDMSFSNFEFKGGGICIATSLGSTGFNFNNSGPILPINSHMWVLTGIICNRLINDIITKQRVTINASCGRIFLDGIDKGKVSEENIIKLEPDNSIKLGFLNESKFLHKRFQLIHRFRK